MTNARIVYLLVCTRNRAVVAPIHNVKEIMEELQVNHRYIISNFISAMSKELGIKK